MQLEEIQKARSRFLQELYERTNGDQEKIDSASEIGGRLGFDEEQTIKVIQYLMNDSLISVIDETGELIQITHEGVTSIERKEKEARSELLHWIYKNSHGDEKKHFDLHQFDENLGFHPKLTNRVVQFLKGEGFIRKVAARTATITHLGVKKAEGELSLTEELADSSHVKQVSRSARPTEGIDELHDNTMITWNPLRSLLQQNFNFGEIKDIVGLAGMDLTKLAHLQQTQNGGTSKSQLMTGIDGVFRDIEGANINRFIRIATEEVLKRKPELEERLRDYLSRLGCTLYEGAIIPIALFDVTEFLEIPESAHTDFVKAATRFRDGDLSGALSSACGAVDSVTARVYSSKELGDPSGDSFQGRVNKSLKALDVHSRINTDLNSLGWTHEDLKPFKENFKKSISQTAYIMQTLRSNMGDVHGTKPTLRDLVFNSIKWAELIVRLLRDED